jgi:hypothetical protein
MIGKNYNMCHAKVHTPTLRHAHKKTATILRASQFISLTQQITKDFKSFKKTRAYEMLRYSSTRNKYVVYRSHFSVKVCLSNIFTYKAGMNTTHFDCKQTNNTLHTVQLSSSSGAK